MFWYNLEPPELAQRGDPLLAEFGWVWERAAGPGRAHRAHVPPPVAAGAPGDHTTPRQQPQPQSGGQSGSSQQQDSLNSIIVITASRRWVDTRSCRTPAA